MYGIYKIQNGDTVDSLAKRYGVTTAILRDINKNSNFEVGSSIVVPTLTEYFDVYTIEKGDNLYNIAKRYNTDYNLLALLNGLNINDYIYPNMTILIPKKDVKYYMTKDNDTLFSVNRLLNGNINKLLNQNNNIYLKEGQLIVYKE